MRAAPTRPIRRYLSVCLGAILCCVAQGATAQEVTLSATGVSDDIVDRLRANSLLLASVQGDETPSAQDIVATARAEYGRLVGILYESGYFAPRIQITIDGQDATRISPFAAPSRVETVSIQIDPGVPFEFGTAIIAPITAETELPTDFRSGAPASTRVLRDATGAAIDGWRDAGRATASLASQSITARNRDGVLDADIAIAPGPVVTFGALIPDGQARMTERRIRDIAGLPTGEVYSPETLGRAEERLRDSGAFSAVQLSESDLQSGDVMDITARIDEAPLRRFGLGVELSTDDGIGASAYWLHRNLFGGAERLRFDASISGVGLGTLAPDIELSAQFDRPATITPDTLFTFETSVSDINDPLYEQTTFDVEARLSDRINRTLTGSIGIGLGYASVTDQLGQRDITRFTLPLGLTWDNRDTALDASTGAFADLELTPFLPVGGSAGAYVYVDGRGYVGLGADSQTRLAGRVQLGTVVGSDITHIPPDFLFASGGSGTVRGQDFQSLASIQNGANLGGRSFVGLSGEVRHDIG
ncbi:MAG: BamA/TamA family outer membrane protein, partial [Octadecabacter sp.]|nr:BamA/TamA family outer membrane protein [Octadecabacter sp.]